jgi:hypothetical protein
MTDRNRYVNTDELQADDEISPKPASDGDKRDRPRQSGNARISDVEDDARLPPRPATSE